MSTRPRILFVATILTALAAISSVCMVLVAPTTPAVGRHDYSYMGDDYPELWDVPPTSHVGMTVQESRSYPIHGGHNALEIWATTNAKGFGYVRLGAEQRAFAVSMFHQLHCVRLLRAGLAGRYDAYARGHMQHCLNYLRQMILCSPDLTLEPADVLTRDFELDRTGATHVCSDWTSLYSEAAANWAHWYKPGNASGLA